MSLDEGVYDGLRVGGCCGWWGARVLATRGSWWLGSGGRGYTWCY